ncbi:DUF6249 domain-containing protein [Brumimicrobium mesophilum]|uniref:DUF6249 domain-containing protein n=1 Tax=Brumimicrobium mesophilum TaxID=392717 RepID=UPI000D140855|nr:DUF6249 domain-containing protein [Brumimicrobium mesophilum]
MEDFLKALVPIIAILSTIALPIVLGVIYALKTEKQKHIERMELIKQGLMPPVEDKETPNRFKSLKNAVVLIGIGLGLIVGLVIANYLNLNEERTFWVVGPSITLFLGAAFLTYYLVTKNQDNDLEG